MWSSPQPGTVDRLSTRTVFQATFSEVAASRLSNARVQGQGHIRVPPVETGYLRWRFDHEADILGNRKEAG